MNIKQATIATVTPDTGAARIVNQLNLGAGGNISIKEGDGRQFRFAIAILA